MPEGKTNSMRLEDLTAGISLNGLEPSAVATIVAVVSIAEGAVQLIYKTPDGTLKDRLLNRADESNISIATTERPWSFEPALTDSAPMSCRATMPTSRGPT
jgi:hypothetical protein